MLREEGLAFPPVNELFFQVGIPFIGFIRKAAGRPGEYQFGHKVVERIYWQVGHG